MRIGMILDTSFPPDPRVENEAVSLIKAGHEVFLFSLDYNGNNKEEDINGIQVKRFPAGKIIYKLSALAYSLPFYHLLVAPKISEFIEANKIEVIHIHDMLIAQAVFDLNKKWKLPIVLDLHENRPAIMEFYKHVKSFSGRLLIDLKKWESKQEEFLKKADRVILVTEEAKEDLTKKYKLVEEKITAVPNTTVTDIFLNYPIQEEIKRKFEGGFNILYVGDTGLRRGTDTAIKAVALIKDKIRNIKLILVGKSKEDVILKELANKLGVTGHVSFEGWQDLKKFPSYILAADVCISPLTRNLHHDTTYANKIFQYMAMGKAVIVSDCIAQAKVVTEENCGLVHSAGNETDLAEKILRLFKNPNLKDELGDHARKAAESKYNWSITSKDLIKTYRLLEEKSQTKP